MVPSKASSFRNTPISSGMGGTISFLSCCWWALCSVGASYPWRQWWCAQASHSFSSCYLLAQPAKYIWHSLSLDFTKLYTLARHHCPFWWVPSSPCISHHLYGTCDLSKPKNIQSGEKVSLPLLSSCLCFFHMNQKNQQNKAETIYFTYTFHICMVQVRLQGRLI